MSWPREAPRVSIVIPVYEEGEAVVPVLDRILENVRLSCEVLVVYDDPSDSTAPVVADYARRDGRVRPTLNTLGRGPARAIRFGMSQASAPVAVVTMADGSDDPQQIDDLTKLVERGVVIAAASRYMSGGRQIGGPPLKSSLSRLAGISLYWLGRVGTRDATNSFKAYATDFVDEVGIESDAGFEIGIELVAKARRRRRRVAEIPTIWLERSAGNSTFQVARWMPRYFHWYRYAFGPKLAAVELPVGTVAEPEPHSTLA
ncbi:MAG: glycosyltransferase [Acidimicrobiia bacterium]|nr:glycosyltransferase [Acidimicrobiia bacterium]